MRTALLQPLDQEIGAAARIGSPLNVQSTFPAPNGAPSAFSPLWAVYAATWTKAASTDGKQKILKSQAAFQDAANAKLITAPAGKPSGAAGIIVNCPVVAFASKWP